MKTISKAIFFLLLISCNQNNQKVSNLVLKEKKDKIEKKSHISIDEKIKNKEKIFLDFWLYMSNNEYYQVGSKLKSKNIISGQNTYSIEGEDFNCIFEIHPLLRNDSLISITLESVPDADPWVRCKFLQKYKDNFNARSNINGPEKVSSIDIKDIIRLYTKKYRNPIIIKPYVNSSYRIYRWFLKNTIIEVTPRYFNYTSFPIGAGEQNLGSALVSIEILYLDKTVFENEQYERRKTIENEKSSKRTKINKTLKDI
jgi:hypothetical protein